MTDKVEMMVDEASELIVDNARCLQAKEIKADPRFGIVHRYVTMDNHRGWGVLHVLQA